MLFRSMSGSATGRCTPAKLQSISTDRAGENPSERRSHRNGSWFNGLGGNIWNGSECGISKSIARLLQRVYDYVPQYQTTLKDNEKEMIKYRRSCLYRVQKKKGKRECECARAVIVNAERLARRKKFFVAVRGGKRLMIHTSAFASNCFWNAGLSQTTLSLHESLLKCTVACVRKSDDDSVRNSRSSVIRLRW